MLHMYYFGKGVGYAKFEIVVGENQQWEFIFEGRSRKVDFSWTGLTSVLETVSDVKLMMSTIEKFKICSALSFDRFDDVIGSPNPYEPLFHTKTGEPAVFREINQSNFGEKVIRSSICSFFLPNDDIVYKEVTCDSCKSTANYLRTMRSRKKKQSDEISKNTRLDFLTYEQLLTKVRKFSETLSGLQLKIKCLEESRKKMDKVRKESNQDLSFMFNKLMKGMSEQEKKLKDPKCKWDECKLDQFPYVDILFKHVCSHMDCSSQSKSAPSQRSYLCQWENCEKKFTKKKTLLNHIREHTGDIKDEFFKVLLMDQAKALTTHAMAPSSHQMLYDQHLGHHSPDLYKGNLA